MDDNDVQNLDAEYKRYLEIMRPYLGQLLDQDVIEICNSWIQRLSNCKQNEKIIRNKYIFALCYQLAKGVLEDPFLKGPSPGELSPTLDETNSDEPLSELECFIVDLENDHTEILYNNKKSSLNTIEYFSGDSEFQTCYVKNQMVSEDSKSINSVTHGISNPMCKQNTVCCKCSNNNKFIGIQLHNENFQRRVNNLITKMREVKKENESLHKELIALKQSQINDIINISQYDSPRVDNATSVYTFSHDSTTHTSIKCKLKEMQESRDALRDKINNLQDNFNTFNDIKKQEIEDLVAKHKLEVIEVKKSVQEETKSHYEKMLEDLTQRHEQSIKDIKNNNLVEIQNLTSNKDEEIFNKDQIIFSKDNEIKQLKTYIDELKNKLLDQFSNVPNGNPNSEVIKQRAEELERRLDKVEKSKIKCSKTYDTKVAKLQREKYLTECSFHLQLVRQRAQVIHELSDEHETELSTALNKLESKYKEIVTNVQSTAVQRRIQDQMALESIIQAVCGVRNEGMYTNSAQATCPSQLTNKATRNQTRDGNGNCDTEMPTVYRGNKIGSVNVGNKSFGEESVVNDYCLDSEKFGELFEKLCIPQRDTGNDSAKK